MRQTLYDFCRENGKEYLLAEWQDEENAPLAPGDVTVGSHREVWWRCGKGHSWRAQVRSRVQGSGCPVCMGKKVLPGDNDLASRYPALAREWDAEKNAPLTPAEVSPGSPRPVWWRCEKGHSWRANIGSRTRGCGCPVCSGRRVLPGFNDFASAYPAVAAEWDAEKNGELTPEMVTPASNRKVWWRCRLGHSYAAVVADRTLRGQGCPYCAGKRVLAGFNDLATIKPGVAAQWHPDLNGSLTPETVTPASNHKVWWQCPLGHVWRARVYSRTAERRPCGCPVCAGKVNEARLARYENLVREAVQTHGKYFPPEGGVYIDNLNKEEER